MTELSAGTAAHIASAVYGISNPAGAGASDIEDLEYAMNRTGASEGLSVVRAPGILDAETGLPGFRKTSAFGVLMERSGGGINDHVLALRGTIFKSPHDWASNTNVGLSPGPGGIISHLGFTRVFQSLLPEVSRAAQTAGKLSTLHVVGHSLGGAVATLFASHFKSAGVGDVRLYTFGAPRAIGSPTNMSLAGKLGAENIRRVYSPSDPVPMVPIFPFLHMPGCDDQMVDNRSLISIGAHSITDNYRATMIKTGWPRRLTGWEMFTAEYWLDVAKSASSKPFSTLCLWALNKALIALIKLIVGSLQIAFMGPLTLIDRLAALVKFGIDLGKRIGNLAVSLLRTIAEFLGIAANIVGTTAQLTAAVVRYLISRLLTSLANMAAVALGRLA